MPSLKPTNVSIFILNDHLISRFAKKVDTVAMLWLQGSTLMKCSLNKKLQLICEFKMIITYLRTHFTLVFPWLWTTVLHAPHFGSIYRLRYHQQRWTRSRDSRTRAAGRRSSRRIYTRCSGHMVVVFHSSV